MAVGSWFQLTGGGGGYRGQTDGGNLLVYLTQDSTQMVGLLQEQSGDLILLVLKLGG